MIKSPAMRFAGALVILVCLQAAAQSPSNILDQIRRKMTDNLLHLPDYTCRETIERTTRGGESKRYTLLDRLRLDVAYVGGRELYAWPGANRFGDQSIADIVEGGPIGNGAFGGFAREVFNSAAPAFYWGGFSEANGRKLARFDFRVPLDKSRYVVQNGATRARVAYRGHFEADAQTLLPSRFEIDADAIPDELKLRLAGQSIEYGQVRIGESQFLLPLAAQLWLERNTGEESRNATRFESCRQYSGESTVRFDVVENDAAAAAALDAPIELPPGLMIEAQIAESIDNATAARGDLVHATVMAPVKRSGRVVVPKGAVLTARVTALGSHLVRSMSYFGVQLTFLRVEFAGRRGDLSADLESAGVGASFSVANGWIYLKSAAPKIPQNLRMLLRTK